MINRRAILSILLPPLLLGCSPPPQATNTNITSAKTTPAKILSTGDGDSLKVRSPNGASTTTRIGCIDAPEYNQEYGPEAGQRLKALLPRGADIALRKITTDQRFTRRGNQWVYSWLGKDMRSCITATLMVVPIQQISMLTQRMMRDHESSIFGVSQTQLCRGIIAGIGGNIGPRVKV
ncbi:thermonuclease family protein [Acaryochloris marina]|uniref:Staphylococcus nuclease, putative n=1 Tax=Acaryochloris marina (strain MBIC 11017) TaxID=329726 RepID=A8ZL95_ACAM1|nr:staphylococcus nuclease, putative [Acaryochloris marina MBIC11017]